MADVDYVYNWDWPRAEREFRLAAEQGAQATTHSYYGWALATRGRFREAQSQLRTAEDLDPLDEHVMLGVISVYRHDCWKAAAQFDLLPAGTPAPIRSVGRALTAACRGENKDARRDLEDAAANKSFISPYQLAMGYAAIGDPHRALEYLNQSAGACEGQIFYIKPDPAFDTIRSDPGFRDPEKKIGLDR
jgi:tetratricopeptide (TPR) repeat protein